MNKDNKVYGLDLSFHGLEKRNGVLSIKQFGINEASTFLGFCSNHDKELFSIFEDRPFISTKEQLCLLSFRSFCREIYGKQGESRTNLLHEIVLDPFEKEYLLDRDKLLDISLAELESTRLDLIDIIDKKDFDRMEYFIVELKSNAKILSSGAFAPEKDFNHQMVCDLSDTSKVLNYIFFNIVNYENRGFCIFSWIKKPETEIFYRFVKSLTKRTHRINDNLVNFVFSYFENTFISIDWFDKLDPNKNTEIRIKIAMLGHVNLVEHRIKNYQAFDFNRFYFLE